MLCKARILSSTASLSSAAGSTASLGQMLLTMRDDFLRVRVERREMRSGEDLCNALRIRVFWRGDVDVDVDVEVSLRV